jgi:hypothetical protein
MTTEAEQTIESGQIVEVEPGTTMVNVRPAELDINLERGQSLAQKMRQIRQEEMQEGLHFGPAFPGAENREGYKPSLLKAGAELLARYFALRVEITLADRTVTVADGNERSYVDYEYNVAIHSLDTGHLLTSIDSAGSCNSRERKYQRADPLDVKNTIQKMAQKRAYVAGILIATGASSFFTQDVEENNSPGAAAAPTLALSPEDVHKRLGSKAFCDENGITPWGNPKKRIVWGEHLSNWYDTIDDDRLQRILRAGAWRDEYLDAGGGDAMIFEYLGARGMSFMLELQGDDLRDLIKLKDALPGSRRAH